MLTEDQNGQGQICLAKMPLLWEKNLLNIVPNRDQFCHGFLEQWLSLLLFFSLRGQSCLGEQKGALALAFEVCVGGNVDTCKGRDHFVFQGESGYFFFPIKMIFVSTVPFSALCCLECSLTSLSPCSSSSCYSKQSFCGRPVYGQICAEPFWPLCWRGFRRISGIQEMNLVTGSW